MTGEDGLTLAVLAAAAVVFRIIRMIRARAAALGALFAGRGWTVTPGQDGCGRTTVTNADAAGRWRMTTTFRRRKGGPALDFAGTRWEPDRERAIGQVGRRADAARRRGWRGRDACGLRRADRAGPAADHARRAGTRAGHAPGARAGRVRRRAPPRRPPVADNALDFAALDLLQAGHRPAAGVFARSHGVTLRLGEALQGAAALAAFADFGERIAALFPPR